MIGTLRHLAADLRPFAARAVKAASVWLGDDAHITSLLSLGSTQVAGQTVTPYTATGFSAVACATSLLAGIMGTTALHVYRLEDVDGDTIKTIDRNHPAHRVLNRRPNRRMTPTRFRRYMTAAAFLWGNAYAEIEFNESATRPLALWPIHPSRIRLGRADNGDLEYYVSSAAGPGVTLEASQVLHLTSPLGAPIHPGVGVSIIQIAAASVGVALAAQHYAALFFANSGRPSGYVKYPGSLEDPDDQQKLRESWSEIHRADGSQGTAVLEEGAEYVAIGTPNEDAQFLQTRQFQVEEWARFANLPPHKLKHLLKTGYNTLEQQNMETVTDSFMPWFAEFEQTCEHALTVDTERHYLRFAVRSLLRGNLAAQTAHYRTMHDIGVYSVNDIRQLEDLNSIGPAGDVHTHPLNCTTLEAMLAGDDQGTEDDGAVRRVRELTHELLTAEFGKLARRQQKALQTAARRHAGDAAALIEWTARYFGDLRSTAREMLTRPLAALFELDGETVDVATARAHDQIDDVLDRTRAAAVAAIERGELDELLGTDGALPQLAVPAVLTGD